MTDPTTPAEASTPAKADDTVTLPRVDYETLLERLELAEDIAASREALGRDDWVPAEFANRILAGESPVRVFRELRRLKAVDLAAAAGIGKSYLSQIEAGAKAPSVEVLKALAAALSVDMDDLA